MENVDNFETNDDYSEEFIEKTKALNEDLTKHLNESVYNFGLELRSTFENRVANFNSQNRDTDVKKVTSVQNEILKTNKIFRDIARPLSTSWKTIFSDLLPNTPTNIQKQKIIEIEKEKSFMQAYKALSTWKELSGTNFNINSLIPVLHNHNMHELASTVENIITCDNNESLFNLSNQFVEPSKIVNKVISSNKEADARFSSNISSNQNSASNCVDNTREITPQDALDDRHLLLLSKKLTGDWPTLATTLSLMHDDVTEILNAEGLTYQGAFRMLHGWRESNDTTMEQKYTNLLEALVKINRCDLDAILRS